jgi:hypothetical protein
LHIRANCSMIRLGTLEKSLSDWPHRPPPAADATITDRTIPGRGNQNRPRNGCRVFPFAPDSPPTGGRV